MDEIGENSRIETEEEKLARRQMMTDLLKEWKEIQKSNATLSIKIFQKRGINQIVDKMVGIKDNIVGQAKMYGKKAESIAKEYIQKADDLAQAYTDNKEKKGNILQEYKKSLEALQKEYQDRVEFVLEGREKFQEEEQKSILKEMNLRDEKRRQTIENPEYTDKLKQEKELKKEIKKALDKGDLDTVNTKNQELKALREANSRVVETHDNTIEAEQQRRAKIKDVIKMCNDTLQKCEEARTEGIDMLKEDKQNKLANIKQNAFQKAMGALFSKLNGAKKFATRVIGKVEEKVYDVNNKMLPAFRENVSDGIDKMIDNINDKKTELFDKASETRDQLMQKAEDKLRESIEKGKKVNEKRSMDYAEIKDEDTEISD